MDTYLERAITKDFVRSMKKNKVLILLGTRRTGKTLFLNHVIEKVIKKDYLFLNGENVTTQQLLKERSVENYKRLIGNNKFLIIDEAQNIENIGWILKLIYDTIKGITIIATGSSSFDLNNKTGEPLTGRKITYHLFPFSQAEFSTIENLVETKSNLTNRMIFGCYPELIHLQSDHDKKMYLNELVSSYLFKDILMLDGIKNASKIYNLLKLLAFQTGSMVSIEELGKNLNMSKNTVAKYMDLLTKVYVIFPLKGLNRNLRSELTKKGKWYFFDNGILNSIINNFNPVSLRNDVGQLWENYIISERIKFQFNNRMLVNNYFWRTYQQQEIDWVEEVNGTFNAYEFKWNADRQPKTPTQWKKAYPGSQFKIVTPENYLSFINPLNSDFS